MFARIRYNVSAVLDLERGKCAEFNTCQIPDTPRALAQKVLVTIATLCC
jgi:hypothetical protein